MSHHPIPKNCFRLIILLMTAIGLAACGSPEQGTRTAGKTAGNRPPQTGTNIPRFERGTKARANSKRPPSSKRKSSEPKPKKKAAKREIDEDFTPRGGFR